MKINRFKLLQVDDEVMKSNINLKLGGKILLK